jgi:hypothetical protein
VGKAVWLIVIDGPRITTMLFTSMRKQTVMLITPLIITSDVTSAVWEDALHVFTSTDTSTGLSPSFPGGKKL